MSGLAPTLGLANSSYAVFNSPAFIRVHRRGNTDATERPLFGIAQPDIAILRL